MSIPIRGSRPKYLDELHTMAGRKDEPKDGKIIKGAKDNKPYMCFFCDPEFEEQILAAGKSAFDVEITGRSEACRQLIEVGLIVMSTPKLREEWRREKAKRAKKPARSSSR